jgi:hypothetical protein
MKSNLYKIFFTLFCTAVLITGAVVSATAQDTAADNNMDILREKIRADKKLLVAGVMELTESEAKAFWPVYESYQNEVKKLGDRSLKLIDDFAQGYQMMSDEAAKKLLDDYMAVEKDRIKLRQDYLPKFRKALPERKVLRYYQLENKLQAVVNYEVAAEIPLAD